MKKVILILLVIITAAIATDVFNWVKIRKPDGSVGLPMKYGMDSIVRPCVHLKDTAYDSMAMHGIVDTFNTLHAPNGTIWGAANGWLELGSRNTLKLWGDSGTVIGNGNPTGLASNDLYVSGILHVIDSILCPTLNVSTKATIATAIIDTLNAHGTTISKDGNVNISGTSRFTADNNPVPIYFRNTDSAEVHIFEVFKDVNGHTIMESAGRLTFDADYDFYFVGGDIYKTNFTMPGYIKHDENGKFYSSESFLVDSAAHADSADVAAAAYHGVTIGSIGYATAATTWGTAPITTDGMHAVSVDGTVTMSGAKVSTMTAGYVISDDDGDLTSTAGYKVDSAAHADSADVADNWIHGVTTNYVPYSTGAGTMAASPIKIGSTTTAVQIFKGDGTTAVVTVDTVNGRMVIGNAATMTGRTLRVSSNEAQGGLQVDNTQANIPKIVLAINNVANVDWAWANYQGSLVWMGGSATKGIYFSPSAISTAASARVQIGAGTATAGTAPLKYVSGVLNAIAEVGAEEFLTDDRYFTITTGAARKGYIFNDGTNLTATRVPIATTNGRLTDDADMSFSDTRLTVTDLTVTNDITGTIDSAVSASWAAEADAATVFTAMTSLEVSAAVSDETGTGALVFTNTPTLITPVIGAATGTSLDITTLKADHIQNHTGGHAITLDTNALIEGNLQTQKVGAAAEPLGSVNNPRILIKNTNSATYNEKAELQFSIGAVDTAAAAISAIYTQWTETARGADLVLSTKTTDDASVQERLRITAAGDATFTENVTADTVFADLVCDHIKAKTDGHGVVIDSPLILGRSFAAPITAVKTAAYTVTAADYTILCDDDTIGADRTITLPTAAGITGRIYNFVVYTTNDTYTFILDPAGSETVDDEYGIAQTTLDLGTAGWSGCWRQTIQSDGTNWRTIQWYYSGIAP